MFILSDEARAHILNNTFRFGITGLALATVSWTAYEMSVRPLWGHLPLWFFTAAWILAAMWIVPEDKHGGRLRSIREMSFFGIASTLAFAPYNFFLTAFVAWLPVLKWLEQHDRRQISTARLVGLSFMAFLLWNILSTYWIANTSFIPGMVAFLLNAFFMVVVVWLVGILRRRQHPRFRSWILPMAWISFEWMHHHWELSWPWLSLGNAFAGVAELVQWYSITGIFGGSLWVLLMNVWLFRLLLSEHSSDSQSLFRRLAIGLLLPMVVSLTMYWSYQNEGEPVKVAVIQPNFEPHYEKFRLSGDLQITRFLQLSEQVLDSTTQYLVFPETSFSLRDVSRFHQFRTVIRLKELLRKYPSVTLVTGIDGFRFHDRSESHRREVRSYAANGGDTVYYSVLNAAMALDTATRDSASIYLKSKLVPGPEIFPYGGLLFFLKPVIEMLQGSLSHFAMQEERSTLGKPGLEIAPVICYESVYGEYNSGYIDAGARAIFVMTNDGWWDNTPGHIQHLALSRLRAIEQRKSVARSANTGISCFIDQKGRVTEAQAYGVEAAISSEILFNEKKSIYQRWGDVIARLSLLVFILLAIGAFFRKTEKRKII